jgi:DNA topoisomerase-3
VPPNQLESDAVAARIEIDLRIGAAFTRFQTMRLQKRFAGLDGKVISYGPCQFPTLGEAVVRARLCASSWRAPSVAGFVVERFQRIASFVPETFWFLETTATKDGKSLSFNWSRTRMFDENACLALYQRYVMRCI